MFTMGKGSTSSYSRKIKLNTRSSTETELGAVGMYMPEMLWMLNFSRLKGTKLSAWGCIRTISTVSC